MKIFQIKKTNKQTHKTYKTPNIRSHKSRRVGLYDKKLVSEYDQEIPQSQTADNPVAPRG